MVVELFVTFDAARTPGAGVAGRNSRSDIQANSTAPYRELLHV